MPDFISDEKTPYYAGLEAADAANARGKIDVSVLERYLRKLLAQQVEQAASAVMPAVIPTPTQLKRDGDAISQALAVDEDRAHARRVPYIAAGSAILAALIGAAVVIGRCGRESRCVVGLQQGCQCVGGVVGTQVCSDDGMKFSACACPSAVADAGTSPIDTAVLDAVVNGASNDAQTLDAGTLRD